MKKRFTLMLLAALVAVTSFAQPAKRQPLSMQQTTELQRTPSIKPFQAVAQPQTGKVAALKAKKAPKKAGIGDISWPLEAMMCSMAFKANSNGELELSQAPYAASMVTLNLVDATTISIVGMIEGADVPVNATVDLLSASFEIAAGQTMMETDYGPIVLSNAENPEAPLTGQLNADGSISINEVWVCVIGGEGTYAGYTYTDYFSTLTIAEPNATMTMWTVADETNPATQSTFDVYVMQDTQTYVTTVFNFGDYGTGLDINMKEDNVFQVQEQPLFYGGSSYGYINFSGLTADYYLETVTGEGSKNILQFSGQWCIYAGTSIYGLYNETSITLNDETAVFEFPVIEDVAAMPADPSVIKINPYNATNGYGYIVVDVPNVDVEGNLLKESKLFYIIYGQKDGEITQLSYPASLYQNLDEDISVIPYTLNDDYDFAMSGGYKVVYLNFDFDYDTMGVQSVYTGGDASNQTEIIWYVPEEIDAKEAQWVAAEQGYENAEEVTDIVISPDDGITGLFAQADGKNQPKFYNTKGEAVRMYAGNTLTISSPDYPIAKIELLLGSRVDIELASDEGEFSVEETTATWEGEANEVVFTVPTGLTPAGQAYIEGINVYYLAEEAEPELIVLPEGAEVEEYMFRATTTYTEDVVDDETGEPTGETQEVTEEVERHVFVAFVDDQVYIQGLSEACPEAWVVGTMTDNVLTIPAAEYLGVYQDIDWNTFTINEYNVFNNEVTFAFDAVKNEFTASAFSTLAELEGSYYDLEEYSDVVLTKMNDIAATPADPEITTVNLDVNKTNYPVVKFDIPTVDTDGNDLLASKLCYIFWVETADGQFQYTCDPSDYTKIEESMTEIPLTFSDDWDIYSDRLYVYAEDFTAWQKIGIQSVYYGGDERHESNVSWMDLAPYWEAVGIDEIAAETAKSVKYFDLQGRQTTADAKGVVIRVARMADGSTKTTKMLRK